MSLTISVLEGLLLLLPGLTALGAWNLIGSIDPVRRPELPLTAVNSLAVAMLVTLVTHLAGGVLCELVARAAVDWNSQGLPFVLPALANPYANALQLLDEHPTPQKGEAFAGLLLVILIECVVVARIVRSRGVALIFAGYDLRGAGWAHKHYMEPLARGYIPIAFAMLKAVEKGRGLAYAGPIADLRFGSGGEMVSISLGQPQRFIYELRPAAEGSGILRRPARLSDIKFHEPQWVGGVIHLSAGDIHNLVVHNQSRATT